MSWKKHGVQPPEGSIRWRIGHRFFKWAIRAVGPWAVLGWATATARHHDRPAYVKALRHLRVLDKQDRARGA